MVGFLLIFYSPRWVIILGQVASKKPMEVEFVVGNTGVEKQELSQKHKHIYTQTHAEPRPLTSRKGSHAAPSVNSQPQPKRYSRMDKTGPSIARSFHMGPHCPFNWNGEFVVTTNPQWLRRPKLPNFFDLFFKKKNENELKKGGVVYEQSIYIFYYLIVFTHGRLRWHSMDVIPKLEQIDYT